MNEEELFEFLHEKYSSTSRKTFDTLLWTVERFFNRGKEPVRLVAVPTNVLVSGGSRIFFGTKERIVKKRYSSKVQRFSLLKEYDFLLIEADWNDITMVVYYKNREVPPL